MDASETVATYGAAWNEPDEGARLKLLQDAWGDDAVYCDPTATVTGRDPFVAHISGFREQFPGARIDLASGVEEHHGWVRFAWSMAAADGSSMMDGFDVGEIGDDGRLKRIVGFFGPFPPLDTD